MASGFEEDAVHKQTIDIEDLKTRSVTLYPSRAAIVRDIEGVIIKPGRNEITISGISTQADENTIRVEGRGVDALITDTVIQQVYRKRDVPSNDGGSLFESTKGPEFEEYNKAVEDIQLEIEDLQQEIYDTEETLKSCSNQVSYIEQHITNLSTIPLRRDSSTEAATSVMTENIKSYGEFRAKVYQDYRAAQINLKKLRAAINKKFQEQTKINQAWTKSQQEAHAEILKKSGTGDGRPLWVKQVTVTIESNSLPKDTQFVTSSVSTGKPPKAEDDEPPESNGPSLRISYITTGASWTPRYDLRLDTTSETGILTYRAESVNLTGETWRDANITLSTSQTSFSGLGDKVPWMDSWRLNLRKNFGTRMVGDEMYSPKEKQIREERRMKKQSKKQYFPAVQRYSPTSPVFSPTSPSYSPASPPQLPAAPVMQSTFSNFGATSVPSGGGLFGSAQPSINTGGLFGSNAAAPSIHTGGLFGSNVAAPFANTGSLFGSNAAAPQNQAPPGGASGDDPSYYDQSDDESDSATLNPSGKMGLALSNSQSYGLTTTYDLPGARTIPFSKLPRRHVITEFSLPDIVFAHVAVPKLHAAVFLKAMIKNSSPTPLLRATVGLNLDGSFLGNSTISRCAPGGTFELGLGIDEEVLVEYRKPVHKVASQGMLVKEQVATYERGTRLFNARGKAVKVLVFDQVPISEDEKLKISVLNPRGLRNVGDIVKISGDISVGSGASSSRSSVLEKKDPEIQVELRKGGEIRYQVSLDKGKEVFLPLEYEARLPAGETMSGV